MINSSPETLKEPKNLEEDFNLAFKLVFFDENDSLGFDKPFSANKLASSASFGENGHPGFGQA